MFTQGAIKANFNLDSHSHNRYDKQPWISCLVLLQMNNHIILYYYTCVKVINIYLVLSLFYIYEGDIQANLF